jgi:hypothetical protein
MPLWQEGRDEDARHHSRLPIRKNGADYAHQYYRAPFLKIGNWL